MGLLPISKYNTVCLKELSIIGAISWQNSFLKMDRIASGPAVLETLRLDRSLLIPAVEILISIYIVDVQPNATINKGGRIIQHSCMTKLDKFAGCSYGENELSLCI